MSPPSKKQSVENPKEIVRKKAIAIKGNVDNVVSGSVKRKQLEVASNRKKAKAKRAKLTAWDVSSSLEVDKTGGVSSSHSIKVCIVWALCILFMCFFCSNRFCYYVLYYEFC